MDPDSSTGNDNSESGECDSFNDENSNLSRTSPKSDRTNIDALDDTARDTIILPPTTDDSSNSIKSLKKSATIRVDLSGDHELLDFGDDGEIVGEDKSEEDEDAEGEIEDDGELEDEEEPDKPPDAALLEEGEVAAEGVAKPEEDGEELEEGEVTDDEERKDKPICRFFSKGQCTWGTNCRFLHPGVTDKGLYTMFDPMRPLLPLPVNPVFAPKPGLLGIAPPNFPPLVKEEPVIESAWERGLRHAKEIIKQSVKRKETDVDFEEKKMNLSLAQEDLDKENDYYVRKPTTPEAEPPPDDFDDFEGLDWPPPPAAQSVQSESDARLKIDPDFVRERVHRLGKSSRGIREAPPRDGPSMIREAPPLHEPEVRMVRESALRRNRFDSFNSNKTGSRRPYEDPRKAEEWHDPWMRSKSPGGGGGGGGERGGAGGRTSRKDSSVSKRSSYSSGSSKSSSRSSSSSKSSRSSSSKSSKSSRGSQKSAGGAKGRRKELRKAPPRKFSPKPVRIAPPPPPKEEFGRRNFGPPHFDRPTRYAPPPPPATQPPKKVLPEKDAPKGFLRERDMKKRLRRRSRSWSRSSGSSGSRSRSRSRTFTPSRWSRSPRSKSISKSRSRSASSKPRVRSKFSRERSRSRSLSRRLSSKSRSSSSSSSSATSFKKTARKRKRSDKSADVDNNVSAPLEKQSKVDNSPKLKTPHKGQIKMTLKSSSGFKANRNVLERLSDDFVEGNDSNSIKEISPAPNEDISKSPFEDPSSLSPKESKTTRVRREELLKQLKAVEEAIAKKRSKLDKT